MESIFQAGISRLAVGGIANAGGYLRVVAI